MSESTSIDWSLGDDGVVTLTLDDPAQSANTMNDLFNASFAAVIDRLDHERDGLRGVIITSAKKTFFAGGDLNGLIATKADDAERLCAVNVAFKARLRTLETLGVPVVAALNGSALGGGLEIALACHFRIAADEPRSRFGLPEVTLGLLPGGGGVVRTVRLLGVQRALEDVLLTGRTFRPADAVDVGLIDEVAADQAAMLRRAHEWIEANPGAVQAWDAPGYRMPGGRPTEPPLDGQLGLLPALLRKSSRGAPAPAEHNILCAAVEGAAVDLVSAGRIETRYFIDLATSQIAKNLIRSRFFDMQKINRGESRPAGFPAWRPAKVAVLGAGMMGAGIAYQCAVSGLEVVLKDVDGPTSARGKEHSKKLLDRAVAKGSRTAGERDEILGRILATADAADCAGADVVIEAVFEDQRLKGQVMREVAPYLAPDALLGSNTSTLPITGLAEAVDTPDRFIGLHFFSPVDRMSLLEIIVGQQTSDRTLAQAFDLARLLGKSPIVVNDARGFFTSRVIGPFIDEGVAMLGEGVNPMVLERAATACGYPVGTLQLTDELNMLLAQRVRAETKAALEAQGLTFTPNAADIVRAKMIELGRPGRVQGAGFFEYGEDGRRTTLWPGIFEQFPLAATELDAATIKDRMMFAETIEAIKCFEEGVIRSVTDANVGSILGIGFPAWTGGILQFVNQYDGGPAGFVARADELAERFGDRFLPPSLLRNIAADGGTFE